MKKTVVLAAFILSFSACYAQFDMGLKVGYTSSLSAASLGSVLNEEYNLNSVKTEIWNNFHAGAFARISFDKVYVQPEVLYAIGKKNYQISLQDAANNEVTYDKFITVSTVDVPLLVGYKLLDLKAVNIRVFAGPKLRLNAGSQLAFENVVAGASGDANVDPVKLEAEAKAAQVGLEAGFGVDILKFTVDARYNLIGDMYTTKINDVDVGSLPRSTIVVSIGWKLL